MPVLAQNHPKQIESVKVAFITQRLDLTTEESQRFWPVYNNYQQEMQQLVGRKHKERFEMKKAGTPVDELKLDSEILELRKRYRIEFTKVLPKEKVTLFYQAEREFRQELIQHLKKRRANN